MTPLDLAYALAGSPDTAVEAAAIIARGMADPDPSDPLRLPYTPEVAAKAALRFLHLDPALHVAVLAAMPTIPSYLLNYTPEA